MKQLLLIVFVLIWRFLDAQMTATFQKTTNTLCSGLDCLYDGPSILINEIMLSPSNGDGSLSSYTLTSLSQQRGEWIELYNPNLCESIDIGCYYLGNNTNTGHGGYIIPANTIVPPAGFCIIRGVNAPPVPSNLLAQNGGKTVEVIVPAYTNNEGNCTNDIRIWFPNAGGWFAFYDRNGVVQDAVTWGPGNLNDRNGAPCVPVRTGCGTVISLSSYTNIPNNRKTTVTTVDAGSHMNQSIRRETDGGAWNNFGWATYGTCNGPCFNPNATTCDATATITVNGGTAPYTYSWNDSQVQTTATATGLCAGSYIVTVKDASNVTQTFDINIDDFEPTVNINIQNEICLNADNIPIQINPLVGENDVLAISGIGIINGHFDPAAAGEGVHTITCDYSDLNGCRTTAATQIKVLPIPSPTWDINSPYCLPTNANINLNLNPSGGVLTGPGVNGTNFNPTLAGAGNHILNYTVTNEENCSSTITGAAIVVQSAQGSLIIEPHICEGQLSSVPIGNLNNESIRINDIDVTNGINANIFGPGNYTIKYRGNDNNGCLIDFEKPFDIYPNPILTLNIASKVCNNIDISPIEVSPIGGVLSGDHVNGNSIIPGAIPETGLHVLYSYTSDKGCYNEITKSYDIVVAKTPILEYGTDCFFNAIMEGNFQEFKEIKWISDFNKEQLITGNYYLTFDIEGEHSIFFHAIDINNCPSTLQMNVDIPKGLVLADYQVPNVITPNGDGINDYLKMSDKFNECLDYKINIINRWGNHVFTQTNSIPFQGKDLNDQDLPFGVYFYEITAEGIDYKDATYKPYSSGFIEIIR